MNSYQPNPIDVTKELEGFFLHTDDLPLMICEFLTDITITYVNKAFCQCFGKTEETLPGLKFYELIPSSEVDFIKTQIQSLTKEKPSTIYQHQVFCNGSIRWLQWYQHAIFDSSGHPIKYQGVGLDITEYKNTETELRNREHGFRTLLDTSPAGTLVCQDGSILLVNKTITRMLAAESSKDLIGKPVVDFFSPEDQSKIKSRFNLILSGEPVETPIECRIRRLDGTLFDAEVVDSYLSYQNQPCVHLIMLDISKRKQKEALESKHQTELEALNRIVNILQFTHTSSEALPALMHETLKALDVTDGCILLYQPKTGELHMTVASGWFEKYQDLVVKPGKGISSAVLESGKTYISDDFSKDPQIYVSNAPPDWAGACVPIHSQDSVIGVLFVSCKLPRTIQPHEVQLLEAIAQIAGISLHRTKLLENTIEQLDNLEAHLTINEAIAHLHNIDLTLEIICKKSLDILSADAIRILLFTATDHKLHHKINEGFCDEHNQKAPLMLGEGCAGKAALERKFFLIDNLENCDPPFEDQALAAKEGFIAYAALPMIAKGKLIGMFEIFHRRPFDHDSVWLSQASSMALKTAVAIDDLQIYNQIKLTNLNLQQAFDSTIEGWSQALEIRDRETEGHTLRVTEMTVQLAKALGTADDEIIHIRRGALLHDVGKLGIPDHILQKPGPLTDDEWEIMKKHPDYAYHMLSPISYLRQAIDIPYCHHEKWDGSGYPRGLKGRQIPLAARIFTVIDVWDAISADRPYDNAWPEGDVLDYLRAQSGKQFDPEVVSVFLKMIAGNNHR